MSVSYPGDAWIKEFQNFCNADPEFSESCQDLSGKMIWQIEAEPGKLEKTVNRASTLHPPPPGTPLAL